MVIFKSMFDNQELHKVKYYFNYLCNYLDCTLFYIKIFNVLCNMLKYLVFIVSLSITYCAISQNIVPASMSNFVDNNGASSIDQVWFTPEGIVGTVGKFHKVEIGFKLGEDINREVENFITKRAKGINPFDPEQIDVSVKLIAPNGKEIVTHGFYYLPYFNNPVKDLWIADTTSFKWRMRFAPDQIGKWEAFVTAKIKGFPDSESIFKFNCIESKHKGLLMNSHTGTKADGYLYFSETNETFIPLGHNITTRGEDVTPSKNEMHKNWVKQLGTNGGNFFRMEMPAGGALPDWPIYNDYSGKLGKMYGYDEVVELAEALEMYFIMFRHHVEVGKQASWGVNWDCWTNNPYKKSFNLGTSKDYFLNEEVIKFQKHALRYIMARWGYSPSFAFYGYSEVDLWVEETGLEDSESFKLFADWFVEMKNYIKTDLHFTSDKFICSFRSGRVISDLKHPKPASKIFDECDVISLHTYSYKKNDNYRRFDYLKGFSDAWDNKKPVLLEETGIELNQGIFCCTDINFHNTIWASSFSGAMGSGLHWNWDRGIHGQGYYSEYNNLNAFFKGEDFRKTNYVAQRWKNDGTSAMKNATIENFALVSENKERALGWVHNATFYWRDLFTLNPCIKELLDNNGVLKKPCETEDESAALGSNTMGYTYDNKEFMDKFSRAKGAQEVHANFVIKGLKGNGNRIYNPWANQHWYKISYYSTRGEFDESSIMQIESTNAFGKLKPKAPKMGLNNSDYSYKIEYMGFLKKKNVTF